jgi:hypothetical protein
MALTPEQFNLLVTKEDLKNLASKMEMREMFEEIMFKIEIISHKLDHINQTFISPPSFRV